MTSHTTDAPNGTVRYLVTPKIPIPDAISATSAAMLPRSANPRMSIVKNVCSEAELFSD
jgi:hypothetical protein